MKNISFRLELLTFELCIHPYIVHQGRFRMLLSCQLSIQSALLLRQPKMYQVFCWWCWGKTTKIFFIHEKQGFSRILRKIAPIFDDVSQGFPIKHRVHCVHLSNFARSDVFVVLSFYSQKVFITPYSCDIVG